MSSIRALLLVLPTLIVFANCKYIDDHVDLDFSNVQMHPDCAGKYYCLQEPDDYPHKVIERLIKGLITINLTSIDQPPEHRKGDENTPCKPTHANKPIYQVKDINNKVRFVVQNERFKQIVRLEWCGYNGQITKQTETLPFDIVQLQNNSYVATCEELYTNYKFLVLSLDGRYFESVMVGSTSIPVCCRCKIHRPY